MTTADFLRLARRVMMVVRRGRVTLVDDTGVIQKAQVDVGPVGDNGGSLGVRDKTKMVQQYGFFSNPPAGTDVIVLAVGGDFSNAVVIASNNQTARPTGSSPGDSGIYDNRLQKIFLTSAGITVTDKFGQTITLSASGITLKDQWSNEVIMAEGQITLQHRAKVVVQAPDVELGATGGQAVARVGDTVTVGGVAGTITSGSAKVKAG